MTREARALRYPTTLSDRDLGRFTTRLRPQPDGCVVITGAPAGSGYVGFLLGGHRFQAHRLAYVLAHGSIPVSDDVDHLCRNRVCVNVAHLQAVPHGENVRRGFAHRRGAA